jgi:hypothetical protein
MRKTAEFEAQQARERAASESKSSEGRDQAVESEFFELDDQHQPSSVSSGTLGEDDEEARAESDSRASSTSESAEQEAAKSSETPETDADCFVHVKREASPSPAHDTQGLTELAPPATITGQFGQPETKDEFAHATAFPYRPTDSTTGDGFGCPNFDSPQAQQSMDMGAASAFSTFSEQHHYTTPSVSQFASENLATSASIQTEDYHHLLRHHTSADSLAMSDNVSSTSMPESPSTLSDLRFKSPPPPADIAGRRKMRRPAPLGLSSLRGGPGPKTGIEGQRRLDAPSPMRRISSASGSLCGRVQKTFMGPSGPRSPFAMDRTKEALLQSLQGAQAPMMTSMNSATGSVSPDGGHGHGLGENTFGANSPEEEQCYPYGSLGSVGGLPLYNTEAPGRTSPGTPALPLAFHEPFFPTSVDHSWNFVPQDEPLPTPSLCSHGGSELEFSMASQLPGYVASQPVTPSFPPTIGPNYGSFFGTSLGSHTEYHFPDSYPAESSARSSPVAPPRSKQFQFAQNVTPQDFNADRP